MPPVPRPAGPTGPAERWPSARKVLSMLLSLGLVWLWVASPVAAQDQVPPPPAVEATGPYRNLAENHTGVFHLTREGNAVYATFQTDRSPVQFLARDQPEVLLTVPEGFRPVRPVTWEVSAEPVLPDGTPHPDHPDRRVFRMQVDTAGQVRYVDDVGVDGVGHLRYHTMLAWPRAGSEPQVCTRPRYIREAILAAVQALDAAAPLCSLVDWEHLARIRTLSLPLSHLPVAHSDILAAPSVRQALLGLTNLAALQVSTPNPGLPADGVAHTLPDPGLPADLLAHTPRLARLEVDPTNFLVLPTGLFRYTPLLTHLSLGYARNSLAAGSNVGLPADLLVPVPHLESLVIVNNLPAEDLAPLLAHLPLLTHLDVGSYTALSETLLAGVPRLTHLTLSSRTALPETLLAGVPRLTHLELYSSSPLPETLLTGVPRLTHLTLYSSSPLPETLLAGVPRLTHLELRNINDPDLPANLLAPVPHLESLHLESWESWPPVPYSASAPGLVLRLSHVPRLTRLTVDARTSLPETFLEGVAHLTHLTVTVREGLELPDTLLAPVPNLESLDLGGQYPGTVLARLLAHMPRLTRLHAQSSGSVSETMLAGVPRLTHLTLTVAGATALPEQLLAHMPQLTHLTLKVAGKIALPEQLLAHMPQLTHLELNVTDVVGAIVALPEQLLGAMPRLTHLTLKVAGATALPARLLAQVPALAHLTLNAHSLALPDGFFAQAPRLTSLTLHVADTISLPARLLDPVPQLTELRIHTGDTPSLPTDFLTQAPYLESLRLSVDMEAFPVGFLSHAPRLKALHLDSWSGQPLPAGFLSHAPRLVELRLHVPRLQALPPGFLAHTPRLETLELDYSRYERDYMSGNVIKLVKEVTPLASLPEGFLSHAPRLRQLKLELGLVTVFPADFLAHAPQLRHLSLDANGVSVLPPDFLARHPGLETVRLLANGVADLPRGFLDRSPNLRSLLLDLQQVEALPEGFLTQAPRLQQVELGVNRVATLPADFLAHAPHLELLNLRALNLTALPPDFLAHAPHIHTLGLAMPLLEPTLAPGHRLWDTLQTASLRVKVARPDPVYFPVPGMDELPCSPSNIDVAVGDILEVWEHARDDHDRRLLGVINYWRDRELSVTFWGYACPYLIDARFTEPTLDVCAADPEPDACVPVRDHYRHPKPLEPVPFRG